MTERKPTVPAGVPKALAVVREMLSIVHSEVWLEQVGQTVRAVSGPRHFVVGGLARSSEELEPFATIGVHEPTQRRIGTLPRGCEMLGELISNPVPSRPSGVVRPISCGVPGEHPPMQTLLGFR